MTDADEYLSGLTDQQRASLEHIRQLVQNAVPEAEEKISTRVPAFYYKDRYLLSYSASRRHLSLFVMQGDIIRHFAERLKGFDTGRRVIRFDSERPLPDALIRDIACFRKQQIDLQQ
ncbi:MAG: hypothetical protein TR69_WS6001001249 [candidate division WS6 bacterium OLB20]|uniref:YdhG-like domain-containing protein n=1 Tax=candidate division WS6 bacterium OLB20 TaxID=1617426 RepID=A0A136LX70_9BACT|nr:MAG: hypothetical protein TR69_WS6001001249 [candidate division WS6 bacterium OLB20]